MPFFVAWLGVQKMHLRNFPHADTTITSSAIDQLNCSPRKSVWKTLSWGMNCVTVGRPCCVGGGVGCGGDDVDVAWCCAWVDFDVKLEDSEPPPLPARRRTFLAVALLCTFLAAAPSDWPSMRALYSCNVSHTSASIHFTGVGRTPHAAFSPVQNMSSILPRILPPMKGKRNHGVCAGPQLSTKLVALALFLKTSQA